VIKLRKPYHWLILLGGLVLVSGMTWAAQSDLGELRAGEYSLMAINNHRPEVFKDSKDYWKSLQNIELKLGGQETFKNLPDLKMKKPYIGEIVLGEPAQKFGIIIDIAGDEKRLYVDSDGDGSFTGESWYPLLNQWQGLQIYWVEGPEPIKLKVKYGANRCPIQLDVAGVVNKPGPFYNEKPYLKVVVRTWFLAKLPQNVGEKLVAVVDRNNNGRYNDPEDQLFIDHNDNGYFEDREMISRKKGLLLQDGKRKLKVDWDIYPEKLSLKEGGR